MIGELAAYEGIVCDLDGVVYRGPTAIPHAVASLGSAGVPVLYATNNASREPAVVADHLRGLGLPVADQAVVTSSQAAAWVLAERLAVGASVLAVGGPGVAAALAERGFEVATGQVRAVVQGYGPQVRAIDLAEAAYAVESGALWIATNTDATLPTDRGIAPGNGTLVAAVARAVGRGPDQVAGKPQTPIYELAAQRQGVDITHLLAIGDRLDTDVAGARAAGMASLVVLTGIESLESIERAPVELRPTWVAADLRALVDNNYWEQARALTEEVRRRWQARDARDRSEPDGTPPAAG